MPRMRRRPTCGLRRVNGRDDLLPIWSLRHSPHATVHRTDTVVVASVSCTRLGTLRGDALSALDYPELRGRRVLVVDDDADNRDLLATIFQRNGALVATAETAAEALREFEKERPHVLISDIGLPDVDGFCLLRTLRAFPACDGGDIPAIALTGYAGDHDSRKQDQAGKGFQAHLTKPVALGDMLATVARVLRAGLISERR